MDLTLKVILAEDPRYEYAEKLLNLLKDTEGVSGVEAAEFVDVPFYTISADMLLDIDNIVAETEILDALAAAARTLNIKIQLMSSEFTQLTIVLIDIEADATRYYRFREPDRGVEATYTLANEEPIPVAAGTLVPTNALAALRLLTILGGYSAVIDSYVDKVISVSEFDAIQEQAT